MYPKNTWKSVHTKLPECCTECTGRRTDEILRLPTDWLPSCDFHCTELFLQTVVLGNMLFWRKKGNLIKFIHLHWKFGEYLWKVHINLFCDLKILGLQCLFICLFLILRHPKKGERGVVCDWRKNSNDFEVQFNYYFQASSFWKFNKWQIHKLFNELKRF